MSAVLESKHLELTKSEVIYGVSWELYESLLEKYREMPTPILTYDSGTLQITMSNSDKHEEANRTLAKIVDTIAEECDIDLRNFGSMTFKREKFRKGFEPDSCFYVQSLSLIEEISNLGIENRVPPDLIIEVNRTSSSVPRMPIFAAFGVKEVWRFDGKTIKFYALEDGIYLETETSVALPILTSKKADEFLRDSRKLKSTAWAKQIRDWVKKQK